MGDFDSGLIGVLKRCHLLSRIRNIGDVYADGGGLVVPFDGDGTLHDVRLREAES